MKTKTQILWAVSLAVVVGVVVAMSPYYRNMNADSIIFYLNAFVKWKPFFWEEDRYGMMIPLITMWITNPTVNVVVQNALLVITSVLSFFLLAKFVFEDALWFQTGLVACISYFAACGTIDLNNFLTPWQTYTPAMMLGLGALILPARYFILSFLLLCLGQWSNFGINIFLAILIGLKAFENCTRVGWKEIFPRLRWQVLLLASSSLFGYLLRRPFRTPESAGYAFMSDAPVDALLGWTKLLQEYVVSPAASLWLPLVGPIAVAVLAAIALARRRKIFQENRLAMRSALVGVAALSILTVVFGASIIAKWNVYSHRYLLPSLILWTVCWSGLAVHLLPKREVSRARFAAAASAVVIAILLFRLGLPSPGAVNDSIAQRMEPEYRNVAKAGCTHVVGDYYRVWDTVFYSRVIGARELWGIAHRASPTVERWYPRPSSDPRICYWSDNEPEAMAWLARYRLTGFTRAETVGDIVVLRRSRF